MKCLLVMANLLGVAIPPVLAMTGSGNIHYNDNLKCEGECYGSGLRIEQVEDEIGHEAYLIVC